MSGWRVGALAYWVVGWLCGWMDFSFNGSWDVLGVGQIDKIILNLLL